MTELNVLPWIEVNEMMDEVYRQQVVADALSQLPKATPELNKLALAIFKKAIQINGFRTFQSIPMQIAKVHVAKEFKVNADLATAVICLWAEKQAGIIESIRGAAREAGLNVPEVWGWQEGGEGFVTTEEPSAFDKLAGGLAEQKSKPEADHYLLAALWLSRGMAEQKAEEEEEVK